MEAYFQKINRNPQNLLNINVTMKEKNLIFPPHWHNEVEGFCVLEGQFALWVDRKEYVLNEGDVFFIGSKAIHYFIKNPLKSKTLFMQFDPTFFEQLSIDIEDFKSVNVLLNSNILLDYNFDGIRENIKKDMLEIYSENNKKQRGYQISMYAILYKILTTMIRKIPEEYYIDHSNRRSKKDQEIIDHIFEFVRKNYKDPISLDMIAKEVNFHPNYFIRYFKKYTGMTFKKYLQLFRIEKAKKLIYDTDEKIIDISLEAGFSSIVTFNRVFKTYTGYSPLEYKKLIYGED